MPLRILFFTIFLLITNFLPAQQLTGSDYEAYIIKYKSIAIREMQLYKIPASITLAQGMIESGCGKSVLAMDSKNHFGIKCQKDWPGDTYFYDDDTEKECFRKYNNVDESYRDHSLFLTTRSRYAALFTLPITDYKGWAYGLKQAGYATNPDYPNILIRLIEKNKLYLLDGSPSALSEDVAINGPEDEDNPVVKPSVSGKKHQVSNEGRILFRENHRMPDPKDFEYLYTSELGRKVYQNCKVPFIIAKKGDTWFSIAKEFKIFSSQVFKQNDLLESDPITPGQMIYLEPKHRKNTAGIYKVKKGDCIYSISQEQCIKLPLLLKYNNLLPGDEPKPGFELKLKRKGILFARHTFLKS